jgi:hypothetical protein
VRPSSEAPAAYAAGQLDQYTKETCQGLAQLFDPERRRNLSKTAAIEAILKATAREQNVERAYERLTPLERFGLWLLKRRGGTEYGFVLGGELVASGLAEWPPRDPYLRQDDEGWAAGLQLFRNRGAGWVAKLDRYNYGYGYDLSTPLGCSTVFPDPNLARYARPQLPAPLPIAPVDGPERGMSRRTQNLCDRGRHPEAGPRPANRQRTRVSHLHRTPGPDPRLEGAER